MHIRVTYDVSSKEIVSLHLAIYNIRYQLIFLCRFKIKNSETLIKEVTRLVRLNPIVVANLPTAIHYLVNDHSVEADVPEVIS